MRIAYVTDKAAAMAADKAALQNAENIAILKTKIEAGEISTVIRPQVQARHIEGTQEFERYKTQRLGKGQTPQSILSAPMKDLQSIVDKSICTGAIKSFYPDEIKRIEGLR